MAQLTDSEVGWLVTTYRPFPDPATAAAVVFAESNGDTLAYRDQSRNTNGGNDRGLWQINSKWHPEVSNDDAFDAQKSTDAAFRISNSGTSFAAWSSFKNGRLDIARGQRAVKSPKAPAGAGTAEPSNSLGVVLRDPNADEGPMIQLDALLWLVKAAGIKDRATLVLYGAAAHAAAGIPNKAAVNMYDDGKVSAPPSGLGCWGLTAEEVRAAGVTVEQLRTPAGNVTAIMSATGNGANLDPLNRWKSNPLTWLIHRTAGLQGVAALETTEAQGGNPWYLTPNATGAATPELTALDAATWPDQLGRLLSFILSAALWRRIGWGVLAAALIILGIFLIVR